jgi:hypothetical protein
MRVVILGCGPAGLLAAHAVRWAGGEVLLVSKPGKSDLFGCQYLHAPIPGLAHFNQPGEPVRYRVNGTPEMYKEKVYGSEYRGSVSADEYGTGEPHLAWDLRRAYDELWAVWGRRVHPFDLDSVDIDSLEKAEADLFISTVPAPVLCEKSEEHFFLRESVWAVGDAPERLQYTTYQPPPFTVECNGLENPRWYRAANVFGYCTVEWPGYPKPPVSGVARVKKPLRTNCDCRPKWLRLGRYGRWEKGYLAHQAFFDTASAYARRLEQGHQEVMFDA